MKALLIMAHGSPRPEANHDILRIAGVVAATGLYPIVKVGYLDCNEPDIATAIDQCVAAGARTIAAVPYFLHSGKHLLRDLPAALRAAARRHPGVEILMGRYLGAEPEMAAVLSARVAAVL